MAKKSRMVQEGKAHKRELARQAKVEQEQKLQEAAGQRLRLSEIYAPGLKGMWESFDPVLPTLRELRWATPLPEQIDGHAVMKQPAFIGRENLAQCRLYWLSEKRQAEEKLDAVERKMLADSRQRNGMIANRDKLKARAERLGLVTTYLDYLLATAKETVLFPGLRGTQYFNAYEKVVCFIREHNRFEPRFWNSFVMCRISTDSRHDYMDWTNGNPVVTCNQSIWSSWFRNGDLRKMSFPVQSCQIMTVKEYQYLATEVGFRKIWLWDGGAVDATDELIKAMERNFENAPRDVWIGG